MKLDIQPLCVSTFQPRATAEGHHCLLFGPFHELQNDPAHYLVVILAFLVHVMFIFLFGQQ